MWIAGAERREFLSQKQVARALGISPRTLRRWMTRAGLSTHLRVKDGNNHWWLLPREYVFTFWQRLYRARPKNLIAQKFYLLAGISALRWMQRDAYKWKTRGQGVGTQVLTRAVEEEE